MNKLTVITFEQWLKENEIFVREQQESCDMGHAEGGVYWWDTCVDGECMTCSIKPMDGKPCPYGDRQKCGVPGDFTPCDCNAKVLYEKAINGQF